MHSALCTLRNTVGATCCGGLTNNAAPSSPRSRPALVCLAGFALAPLTVGSPPKIGKPTTEHNVSNRPSYEPELRSKLLSPALPSQEPSAGALLKVRVDHNGYRPNGRTSDCPPPKRQKLRRAEMTCPDHNQGGKRGQASKRGEGMTKRIRIPWCPVRGIRDVLPLKPCKDSLIEAEQCSIIASS